MDKKVKFEKVREKIESIIQKNISVDEVNDTNGDFVFENYAINSIDALEMLILIEMEFQIEIDDDVLSSELFMDLDNLTNCILEKIPDEYFDMK